jgi:hypothetical protein
MPARHASKLSHSRDDMTENRAVNVTTLRDQTTHRVAIGR